MALAPASCRLRGECRFHKSRLVHRGDPRVFLTSTCKAEHTPDRLTTSRSLCSLSTSHGRDLVSSIARALVRVGLLHSCAVDGDYAQALLSFESAIAIRGQSLCGSQLMTKNYNRGWPAASASHRPELCRATRCPITLGISFPFSLHCCSPKFAMVISRTWFLLITICDLIIITR